MTDGTSDRFGILSISLQLIHGATEGPPGVTGREEPAHKIDGYALKWIYPVSYVVVILWAVYKFLYKPALVLAG